MPKYVFECQSESCNLRFERNLSMGDHKSHPCPSCKEAAPQIVEGFAFAFEKNPSAAIGNTGVHKDDYPTADQLVGRDADFKWSRYDEQFKVKEKLREESGVKTLSRAHTENSITYQTLPDSRLKDRKGRVKAMFEAVDRSRGRR
jgi:putative FmdB family regulatory protein